MHLSSGSQMTYRVGCPVLAAFPRMIRLLTICAPIRPTPQNPILLERAEELRSCRVACIVYVVEVVKRQTEQKGILATPCSLYTCAETREATATCYPAWAPQVAPPVITAYRKQALAKVKRVGMWRSRICELAEGSPSIPSLSCIVDVDRQLLT